ETRRLTTGCGTPQSCAPRVKLRAPATATNASRCVIRSTTTNHIEIVLISGRYDLDIDRLVSALSGHPEAAVGLHHRRCPGSCHVPVPEEDRCAVPSLPPSRPAGPHRLDAACSGWAPLRRWPWLSPVSLPRRAPRPHRPLVAGRTRSRRWNAT